MSTARYSLFVLKIPLSANRHAVVTVKHCVSYGWRWETQCGETA